MKYQPTTAPTSTSAAAISNQMAGIRRQKGRVSAASGDHGGSVQPAIEPGSDGARQPAGWPKEAVPSQPPRPVASTAAAGIPWLAAGRPARQAGSGIQCS
jgi:hypothetical protein